MSKISFEDWKNSMSFMIDDAFDNNFLFSIEPLTEFVNQNCERFSNPQELTIFLTTDDYFTALEKLKAFVSLIGLSEERLKRVVSLLRYRYYAEDFRTEWDVKRISRTLQNDTAFREILIEFFIGGRDSRIGAEDKMIYIESMRPATLSLTKELLMYLMKF